MIERASADIPVPFRAHHRIVFAGRAVLASIALSALAGCPAPRGLLEPFQQGAYEDILERQREGAPIEDASLALKNLPEPTSQDFEWLGDHYFESGKLALAFSKYQEAAGLQPERPELRYKLGLVLLEKQLADEAISQFDQILYMQNGHALAYQGRGRALLRKGDLDGAARSLERSLQIDERSAVTRQMLGVLYDRQQRYGEAADEYRLALAMQPNDPSILNNLGVSYYMSGDYMASAAALEQAIRYGGAGTRSYNNLARTYAKLGRYPEALNAFKRGGEVPVAYNNLGMIYLSEGRREQAAACFQKALEVSPTYYAQASENLRAALGDDSIEYGRRSIGEMGGGPGCP